MCRDPNLGADANGRADFSLMKQRDVSSVESVIRIDNGHKMSDLSSLSHLKLAVGDKNRSSSHEDT
jgi:hypothetical protein